MPAEKKALIASHYRIIRMALDAQLSALGYRTKQAADLPTMLTSCAQQDYDLYFMDANLSYPDAATVEPAEQVYQALYDRGHERGLETRLHVFSGDEDAVHLAQERGLQAYLSADLTRDLIIRIAERR